MAQRKQMTHEDYEKESARSTYFIGGLFILIGIIAIVIGFVTEEIAGSAVIALIFIVLGTLFLAAKKSEKKLEEARLDPNNKEYAKEAEKLRRAVEKVKAKSHKHGSIRDEYYVHGLMIAACVLAGLLILSLFLWMIYGLPYILIFLDLAALVVFIYIVSGHDYKKVLKAFEKPIGSLSAEYRGLDAKAAEEEFAGCAFFRGAEGTLAVTGNFLYSSSAAAGGLLIDASSIKWGFIRRHTTYNYTNGIYTGKTYTWMLIVCCENGSVPECKCSHEGCIAAIDELLAANPRIIAGFKEELGSVYAAGPAEFEKSARELGLLPESPYTAQM